MMGLYWSLRRRCLLGHVSLHFVMLSVSETGDAFRLRCACDNWIQTTEWICTVWSSFVCWIIDITLHHVPVDVDGQWLHYLILYTHFKCIDSNGRAWPRCARPSITYILFSRLE